MAYVVQHTGQGSAMYFVLFCFMFVYFILLLYVRLVVFKCEQLHHGREAGSFAWPRSLKKNLNV